jgi:hypothetical protein
MAAPHLTAGQNPQPGPSKRLLLRSAAFGAGFAVTLCLIGGGLVWYSARTKPPTPWNTTALLAKEPPSFDVSQDGRDIEFTYSVENTTETDYQTESDSQIRMMLRLKNGAFSRPLPGVAPLELPIFIPAKQKGVLTLRLSSSTIPGREASESDAQYHERLRAYCERGIGDVGEFVLFDDVNRYQINLPRWLSEPRKEP